MTVFPGEQYRGSAKLDGAGVPKLIYYNKVDKGGHFAAWEQPWLFAAELRAGVQVPAVRGPPNGEVAQANGLNDFASSRGGTRTRDPGIMSAVL